MKLKGTLATAGASIILADGATGQTTLASASTASRTVTLPDATDTLVGRATTDTITNKSISGSSNTITNIPLSAVAIADGDLTRAKLAAGTANHVVINDGSGLLSSEATLAKTRGGAGADISSITFPSSGTLATLTGTETLTNKTLLTGSTAIADTGDTTKQVKFAFSGSTTGKIATLQFTIAADTTYQFPSGGTLVDTSTGQTLTNKTLTSPKINENVALTSTATQLNYLASATGTTGTAATKVVFSTSPTLTTPVLVTPDIGTPTAGTLTSCTGLPIDAGTTGSLPIARGGTGQTSANAALNAILPTQTGSGGKVLTTDGSNTSWASGATSDNIAPIGTIVAYNPGYYTGATNGGFTLVGPATNDAAGFNAYLPTNWRVCDGSALNDSGSTIFNGASRFLPHLNDSRFLLGSTASGTQGGANTVTLTTTELPSHTHTINHDHAAVTSAVGSAHTHTINHDHASATSGATAVAHTHNVGILFSSSNAGSVTSASAGNGVGTTGNITSGGTSVSTSHTHTVDLASYSGSSGSDASHTHSVDLPSFSGSSGSAGTGSAFSILPQYLGTVYIMRVK